MINIISQEEKDNIDAICKEYGITNYTINGDRTIDVDDHVIIDTKKLTKIPLRFGKVCGDFNCGQNHLTSLEGCPTEVSGDFYCYNNDLTSLEHCPVTLSGHFNCSGNRLTSLEGCPKKVSGNFDCSDNELNSLEFCPNKIGVGFYCSQNLIKTLEYCPTVVDYIFNVKYTDITFKFFYVFYILLRDGYGNFDEEGFDEEFEEVDNDIIVAHMTEAQKTFLKYQNDYEVWTPEFNEDNMNDLLADINDGLR